MQDQGKEAQVSLLGGIDPSDPPSGNLPSIGISAEEILESVSDGFIFIDRLWRFAYVNQVGARLLGTSAEECVGKGLWEVFPEAIGSTFDREFRRAMAGFVRVDFTEYYPPLDAHYAVTAYPSAKGLAVYFRDVTTDIAKERALRETELGLRAMIDANPIGVLVGNVDTGEVIQANDAYLRILGFTRDEFERGELNWMAITPPEWQNVDAMHVGQARESGRSLFYEKEYRKRSGERVPVLVGFSFLDDERTKAAAFVVDLGEHYDTRQKLAESNDRFRAAISAIGTLWTNDRDGLMNGDQPGWEALTGQTRTEYEGLGWASAIHPDDAEPTLAAWEEAVRERRPFRFEHRVRRKDGEWRWFAVRAVPVLREDGSVGEWVGVHIDVTDLRSTEERLHRTQEALGLAMKSGRMGWWAWEPQSDRIVWSPELETIFGLEPGTFAGTREALMERIHPDDRARVADEIDRSLRNGTDYSVEYRFLRGDGAERWMHGRGQAVYDSNGTATAFYGIGVDITDRKAIEAGLVASEEQYRQIAEGLPQMVWSAGPDGVRDYFNRRWLEYTGVGLDSSPNPWSTVLHEEDRPHAMARWTMSIESGEVFQAVYRLRGADGRFRWFLGRAIPLKNDLGEVSRWFGTCTDIHDQKAIQHALEVTNAFATTVAADLDLERIVQSLTDASTEAIGAQYGSFFYNSALSGKEPFEPYTLSGVMRGSFAGFDRQRATPIFASTFRGEGVVRSDDIAKDPRYPTLHAETELPVASYLAVPVISRSGDVIGGLFFAHSDPGVFTEEHETIVTLFAAQAAMAMENARLYEQLRSMNEGLERLVRERTADLEASNDAMMGFTYHVSHDLRTPLRAIVSTSRIIQDDFGKHLPEAAHRLLDRQAEAGNKMAQLIDDLLRYSRLSREDLVRSPVDLTALAREISQEVAALYPDRSLRFEVQPAMHVEGDARLLRLALHNLVENAAKYSPEGGMIRIGRRPDGAFAIEDEGIGIEPRYAERIFEPFQRLHRDEEFKGNGIGLANARQVVSRHGGKIWAESRGLGHGLAILFTLGPS